MSQNIVFPPYTVLPQQQWQQAMSALSGIWGIAEEQIREAREPVTKDENPQGGKEAVSNRKAVSEGTEQPRLSVSHLWSQFLLCVILFALLLLLGEWLISAVLTHELEYLQAILSLILRLKVVITIVIVASFAISLFWVPGA